MKCAGESSIKLWEVWSNGKRCDGEGIGSCDFFIFFFKQKTAYEIYQCDWSSDVCSSDLSTEKITQ